METGYTCKHRSYQSVFEKHTGTNFESQINVIGFTIEIEWGRAKKYKHPQWPNKAYGPSNYGNMYFIYSCVKVFKPTIFFECLRETGFVRKFERENV